MNYVHNNKMGNLDINLGGYFELSFVMVDVCNLYVKLGDYFMYVL